jgi:alpha-tubulin suppressor-like RCC1 family protein
MIGFSDVFKFKKLNTLVQNYKTFVIGWKTNIFLDLNNNIHGIGSNSNGEMGDGTIISKSKIVDIFKNVTNITEIAFTKGISTSFQNSFALTSSGELYGSGSSSTYPQLGVTQNQKSPVLVSGDVLKFSSGQYHTVFTKTDKTLHSVGGNNVNL